MTQALRATASQLERIGMVAGYVGDGPGYFARGSVGSRPGRDHKAAREHPWTRERGYAHTTWLLEQETDREFQRQLRVTKAHFRQLVADLGTNLVPLHQAHRRKDHITAETACAIALNHLKGDDLGDVGQRFAVGASTVKHWTVRYGAATPFARSLFHVTSPSVGSVWRWLPNTQSATSVCRTTKRSSSSLAIAWSRATRCPWHLLRWMGESFPSGKPQPQQ